MLASTRSPRAILDDAATRSSLAEAASPKVSVARNGAAFKDPAFGENKNLPIHRWVPWIAGFSASFVDQLLAQWLSGRHGSAPPVVLDPFAGVGTTLVQAALRGFSYRGFEINPYAALAARVKLQAARLDLEALDGAIEQLRQASRRWQKAPARMAHGPAHFRSRIPFFSPRVECQVVHALGFIAALEHPEIADLFRVAFGAVMVSFSNYTYEPSLGSRPGAGKPLIEDADVAAVVLAKIQQMRSDIGWLQSREVEGAIAGTGTVYQSDFLSDHMMLAPNSVGLMVTSPPYLNNYHYLRNTRPQLYWLSLLTSAKEQKHLEERNFGKFWQTVRTGEPISLAFEHPALRKLLDQLRSIRTDAGPYGGPGWANYAAAYFNDCDRFVQAIRRLLAKGGIGVIVIGNSIIQGLEISTEQILGEIAQQRGFLVEEIRCIRDKRVGASITQSTVRRGKTNRSTLAEYALVVRKGR